MSTEYREGLPPLPPRMRKLPVDDRKYPVPWFVKWFDGKPDFRVANSIKFKSAVSYGLCWVCGESLGKFKTFVVGPMCTVNRITSEPACHLDCAQFAVTACPFMLLPAAQRKTAALPPKTMAPPGVHLDRNPGVTALWTTREFKLIPMTDNRRLISIGAPETIKWYHQGRDATRDEVQESLDDGFPVLWALARAAAVDSVVQLENAYAQVASLYLPAA